MEQRKIVFNSNFTTMLASYRNISAEYYTYVTIK